ncbi:MAG: LacI family DNA-binding transcriptional regulator [Ruthenibacterium sp.]
MNIYDIAEKAGVSIATVSRVINGAESVSAKTKDKVLRVISDTSYTPNVFARGLGLDSIKMIGVLCIDVADMYYAKAVSAIHKLLRSKDYDVLMYCTGDDRKNKQLCLKRLLDMRVDAIFTVGSAFKDNLPDSDLKHAAQSVPIIMINAEADVPNVHCVLCDEAAATYENVRLLYAAGCRHILYLYDSESSSGKAKHLGFARATEELRIASACYCVKSERDVAVSAADFQTACAMHPCIDAVLTSEDILAAGVLRRLAKERRTLPVIGFNNSFLAECTVPSLTSVDNMAEALCATGVSLLSEIFSGNIVATRTVLSPKLVQRESFVIDSNIK